jgi:hypothetical protein
MIESFDAVMKDSSKGWPTFDDFKQGRVFIDDNLVKRVEDLLKEHRRCLIRGAEGRGKTVLARVVANNRPLEEKEGISFYDLRESKNERIDQIYKQFERAVGKSQEKTLVIVENTHTSLDEITPKLVKFANKHREASFIFTSRKILPEDEQFLIENPFEEWEKEEWCVDLEPGLEVAHGIIKAFISAEKRDYSPTEQDVRWITNDFEEGTINLRRLKWYLETWKEKGGRLSEVEKEAVLRKVFKYFLLKELNPELIHVFLEVAGIFQFDQNYYGRAYDNVSLTELAKRGVIGVSGDYYRLQHTSDAAYVIEADAFRVGKEPVIVTTKILKEYLRGKPENYYELMRALFQSKGKRILAEIFNDQKTYDAIFDMIKQDRIGVVSAVISYLNWACGKEKGLEFWSHYKKLGSDSLEEQKEKLKSKLTGAPLHEVMFLLLFLRRLNVNEKDWLVNEVLDVDILAQQTKNWTFSIINGLLVQLPNEKASAFISKLDPDVLAKKAKSSNIQTIMRFLKYCLRDPSNINFVNSFLYKLGPKVIAEKAKSSSAQTIMWFLKYCLRDPSNINFVNSFLFAINKGGELTEKLKNSNLRVVDECLRIIKNINPDHYKELNYGISPYLSQICRSSGINSIAHKLCSKYTPTELSRLIVTNLASEELSEPIRKLYSHSEVEPLKVLSKLLDCVYQVAFETDTDAVERIAQQIVNNINFKVQEKYDPEQLSLLVKNAKKCNELAGEQLCSRIISELNVTDYIRIPFEKGSAELVWVIYQYDEEKGQELANEIFELDFNKLLDSSEAEAVSRLISNLLQINESKVRSWIQNMDEDKFLSKVLSSSTHETFRLLWNLYQIDEEKGKRVAHTLANNVLSDLMAIETKDIPLLGFFVFCDIKMDLNNPIPSPCEIAEEIIKNQSLAELAFCLCFLEKEDDALRKEFLKELGRRFFLRDLTFPPKEKIEKHPIESTRQRFMEIFTSFDLPKEPDSTFVEMIRLTKAYLEEKKKAKVAFSQLRDFFLRNPTNNPIFKSGEDAKVWLSVAINYGIYHEEQVPHHKDPSRPVNLLSLSEDAGLFFPSGGE